MAKKIEKIYKLGYYRARWDKERFTQGTLKELIEDCQGTLECGKAYESDRGAYKISLKPKTFDSLVNNLNKALSNRMADGYSEDYYFDGGEVA